MKRGQVALEFLTTYGWAMLLILIVAGVLAYFGFFSPSQYTPESCGFGAQLLCEDFAIERVSEDSTQISMQLRNNFEKPIKVTAITPLDERYAISGCTSNIELGVRKSMVVQCIVDANLDAGRKTAFPLAITFRNNESPAAALHNVSGEVFAKVPSDIRTSPLLQCSDTLDNDDNGCKDLADTGCTSADDPTESGGDCFTGNPAAELDCVVSVTCQEDYVEVLRLSDYQDAHAGLPGQSAFTRKLCCHAASDTLTTACGIPLLTLTNFTDAHAAQAGMPFPVCLSATAGAMTCAHRASCGASEACLVKLSTDGHVSNCAGTFSSSVCCEIT